MSEVSEWKDVTAECAVREDGDLLHEHVLVVPHSRNGYRLRKVQLNKYDPLITGDWKPGDDYVTQWAFIVEQRDESANRD